MPDAAADAAPPSPPAPGPRRLVLAAALAAFFVGDLVSPLGVAAGMPYVVVVLLAAHVHRPRLVVEVAVVATLLTGLGVPLSPSGGDPWVVAVNRVMAVAVIWATAVLSVQRMRTEARLLEAERGAVEDPLTGLRNRRGFDALVESALGRGGAALVMLDLDRFKLINDDLGHPTGDRALVAVADQLREVLRAGDALHCARLGGDEFAVLLPQADPAAAELVAGRLKAAIDPVLSAIHPACGVSVGVAVAPRGKAPDELFAEADQALYAAKASRREWPGPQG